jgi:hypothetical protein
MQDIEDEPLFCERVAGLDIAKAGVEVTIRVPSDTIACRRQQETCGFGTTRAALESLGDWLACWGVTRVGMEATGGLLEAGVLPAGITRVRLPAVQRRAGQGAAGQARDRPGRLGLAGQDHRAGHGLRQLRAARADPPAAHSHPLSPAPHPGPHRREAASGETAGGRAPETVQRDLRHPRRLGRRYPDWSEK